MEQKKRRRYLFLSGTIFLPFLWIMLLRIFALGNAENSLDIFYHIRIAGEGIFLGKEFPALQLSVWCGNFSDKEMLFHACLYLLTLFREIQVPFHFEYGVFLLGLLVSFCWAARQMNIRARVIFAAAPVLLLLTVSGTLRLTMLRPHLLSLILLFVSFGILAQPSLKRRALGMLILSFIYCWSYSNPHFIALPALLAALLNWKKGKEYLPVLASLTGVFLGLLIHPQFPNSFLIWKVQSIDALAGPLASFTQDVNRIPTELLPPDGREFVTSIPLYCMVFLNLVLMARLWEKEKKLPMPVCTAAVLGLLFTGAFFFMKRAMEYAAPFTVLGFTGLADAAMRGETPLWKPDWKKTSWGIFAASMILAGLTTFQYVRWTPHFPERPALRQYLAEHFAPGTVLLNPDWSDFTRLYYEAPHLRWQWGLDPSFSMAKDPRRSVMLTSTVPAEQLAAVFKATHAVLLYPRHEFAEHLRRCGWVIEKDIPGEAWVFTLPRLQTPPQTPPSAPEPAL